MYFFSLMIKLVLQEVFDTMDFIDADGGMPRARAQ